VKFEYNVAVKIHPTSQKLSSFKLYIHVNTTSKSDRKNWRPIELHDLINASVDRTITLCLRVKEWDVDVLGHEPIKFQETTALPSGDRYFLHFESNLGFSLSKDTPTASLGKTCGVG